MQYVVPGSADVSVHVRAIGASTNATPGDPIQTVTAATAGLALWYRVGATGTKTAISDSDLATVGTAHTDGGIIHVDDGLIRVDLPDAAVPASEGVVTWVGGTADDIIIIPAAIVGRVVPLAPTTAGRTLDVSAGGEAGVDWANVGSPTTAVDLSGTTIDTDQAVASVTGAVGSVTGAVGSVTGNVGGNVTGSVGSVAAGGITAASIATGAVDADALAADAVAEIAAGISIPTAAAIADQVWDETAADHDTAGSMGAALNDAGAAGDPWAAAVRTLTQPAASVVAAVTGSNVTAYTDVTWSIALTGLGDMSARSKVWFIVYADAEAADTEAVVLIDSVSGLTRLAGAAYATAAHGALTFPSSTALTVTLAAAAAAGLTRGTYHYAIKMLDTGGDVTQLSHGGRLVIVQGAPQAIA